MFSQSKQDLHCERIDSICDRSINFDKAQTCLSNDLNFIIRNPVCFYAPNSDNSRHYLLYYYIDGQAKEAYLKVDVAGRCTIVDQGFQTIEEKRVRFHFDEGRLKMQVQVTDNLANTFRTSPK